MDFEIINAPSKEELDALLTKCESVAFVRSNNVARYAGECGFRAIVASQEPVTSLLFSIDKPNYQLRSLGLFGVGFEIGQILPLSNRFPCLESLNLWKNQISEHGVHGIVKHFPGLTALNLRDNKVGGGGARAIAQNLTKLTALNLCNNQVGDIGAETIAEKLAEVELLDLSDNQIGTAGVQAIASNLTRLTDLNLRFNQVGDVGAVAIAENLKALKTLDLKDCEIGFAGAQSLLSAYQNTSLSLLNLKDNPCAEKILTPEVFEGTDAQAILAAWRDFEEADDAGTLSALNEAKLLVLGNEAVGKTSLIRFLIDGEVRDPDEKKTPGISQREKIETASWSPVETEVKLNVWDFAGQEITRGTHRYFLTARSIYLVVLEDRRMDDPPIHRWLQTIESIAGNVPVLILINKSDEGKAELRLDEKGLKQQYKQIVGFFRTSCNDTKWSRTSIQLLREAICKILVDDVRLEHARSPVPKNWLAVKAEIEKQAKNQAVLELSDFHKICVLPGVVGNAPIEGDESRRALLRLLHELGVVVAHGLSRNAPIARQSITLLDPNWLTEAIYKVLTDTKLQDNGGRFTRSDLSAWLEGESYPEDRHEFILSLMQDDAVQLCYRLPEEGEAYLAPEALPKDSPRWDGWEDGALRFRLSYDYLPAAVIPRFIVRTNRYLKEPHDAWRTGARLFIDGVEVLLRGDRYRNQINIALKGPHCRDALSVIRSEFAEVHGVFQELNVTEEVPMPDDPDVVEDYNYLRTLQIEEGLHYEHRPRGAKRRYRVGELLELVGFTQPEPVEAKVDLSKAELDAGEPSKASGFLKHIFPSVFGFYVAAVLGLWSEQEWPIWIGGAALAFGAAWILQRLFLPRFPFRRLFTLWTFAGLSLVAVAGLSAALDLDWIKFQWGDPATWVIAAIYLLPFGILAWLTREEARN